MIASDDGSHFVTGGVRSSRFFKSPRRCDHELIGGKNQFGSDTILRFWLSFHDKTCPAFAFSREDICGAQHVDDVPRFSRADQCCRALLAKIDSKKSRAPKLAFVCVTALLLVAIDNLMNLCWRDSESGIATADSHPKRR